MDWLKDKLVILMADLMGCWKSWTIWLNGVMLTILGALPMVQESFPQLQEYLSPDIYKHAMIFLVTANILLRFKTNSSLRGKP